MKSYLFIALYNKNGEALIYHIELEAGREPLNNSSNGLIFLKLYCKTSIFFLKKTCRMRLAESRDFEDFTKGAHFYWNV